MRRQKNRQPSASRPRRATTTPTSRTPPGAKPTPRTWLGTDAQVVRHVRVCGDGHLAAATRIELERQGIHRDTDYSLPSLRPALVIACADSEADHSFVDVAQQGLEEGSPLFLCCLVGGVVRLGPLIDPPACFARPPQAAPNPTHRHPIQQRGEHQTAQAEPKQGAPSPVESQQFRPHGAMQFAPRQPGSNGRARVSSRRPDAAGPAGPPAPAPHASVQVDAPLSWYARLGAILISAQALNFLLGARNQCVLDRVVELNPYSMESKGYSVLKVRQ